MVIAISVTDGISVKSIIERGLAGEFSTIDTVEQQFDRLSGTITECSKLGVFASPSCSVKFDFNTDYNETVSFDRVMLNQAEVIRSRATVLVQNFVGEPSREA